MNKGILVIDIPKTCDVCPISKYTSPSGIGRICPFAKWNFLEPHLKPDWCPIKPLPEKIQHKSRQGLLQEQVALGWNLCIDDILGE